MTTIFVDDWPSSYAAAYQLEEEQPRDGLVQIVEHDGTLRFQPTAAHPRDAGTVALVDGVRRAEVNLTQHGADGETIRGVAGSYGYGAVLTGHGELARYDSCHVRRLVVWGSGATGELPAHQGIEWEVDSAPSSDPNAPLQRLQRRMREAEGRLADRLCDAGHLTFLDGPLGFIRFHRDQPLIGVVKTHHRQLLDDHSHPRVPDLPAGQRTSLFRIGDDYYSTYLRLAPGSELASPWAGIIRLEFLAATGLDNATRLADLAAATLPRFASKPHADPRAPANLVPVGELERHLKHLLGDPALIARGIRVGITHHRRQRFAAPPPRANVPAVSERCFTKRRTRDHQPDRERVGGTSAGISRRATSGNAGLSEAGRRCGRSRPYVESLAWVGRRRSRCRHSRC